jgi:D-glycero-alpha-D-manno-heptose 1-phosphate guanylyltransferase
MDSRQTPSRAAFLLCGGLGTRLRAVTDRPKAVIPVAGWPFLRYHLERLRGAHVSRIVFLTGHGADQVEKVFGAERMDEILGDDAPGEPTASLPMRIFVAETEPLGTGGALANARAFAADVNLVVNGDSFADYPFGELFAAGGASAPGSNQATILAVPLADAADYGSIDVDASGRILGFAEKARTGAGLINAGAYLIPRAMLEELSDGRSSLEHDHFPRWAAEGRLRAHRADVFFRDIGTPERLASAQTEFAAIRRRLEEAR